MNNKRKWRYNRRRGCFTLTTKKYLWTIEAKGRWILSRRRPGVDSEQRVGTFAKLELAQYAALILAILEGEISVVN